MRYRYVTNEIPVCHTLRYRYITNEIPVSHTPRYRYITRPEKQALKISKLQTIEQ